MSKKDFGAPPVEASENLRSLEIDKRTLRKTGRVYQFNTAVSKEWLAKLKQISYEERLKYVEVLEKALECYDDCRNQKAQSSKKKVSKKKGNSQELYPHYQTDFTCDNCGEEYEEETAYSPARDWKEAQSYFTYCSNCVVE